MHNTYHYCKFSNYLLPLMGFITSNNFFISMELSSQLMTLKIKLILQINLYKVILIKK